jgi:hypothetical protein
MNYTLIDVCYDCYMFSGGYDSHELGYAPEFLPLSKFDGLTVTPMLNETDTFSNYPCSGCDSPLAGGRFTVSLVEDGE